MMLVDDLRTNPDPKPGPGRLFRREEWLEDMPPNLRGMPDPVSATVTRTPASAAARANAQRTRNSSLPPPDIIASRAFPMRLAKNCLTSPAKQNSLTSSSVAANHFNV